MFAKVMYTIHRVLGTLLSALFVMWFLSGIVMIYHTFPSVRHSAQANKAVLPAADYPSLQELADRLPADENIKGLSLTCRLDQPVFNIVTDKERYLLPVDTLQTLLPMDKAYFYQLAGMWCTAPVAKVDTLMELEQWIPFGRLKQDMPIYKFYFGDSDKTQLYISSKSGEVLQCTTVKSRFWAWVGAIPHWVYLTRLRQDADLWKNTVILFSGVGAIMTIAGIYVGIDVYVRTRRNKGRWTSPYKKKWYWWHHVTGFFFGIFVLTWVFSGMMSLADTPEWLATEHQRYPVREAIACQVPLAAYPLDYREAMNAYPGEVKEVRWNGFRHIPAYELLIGQKTVVVNAADTVAAELNLTKEVVLEAVKAIHQEETVAAPEWLTEYDTYYIDRKGRMQLPVWKVKVDNADNTCYYINPANGQVRDYNTRGRWHFWMYPGLHSLKFKWLVAHPVVWSVVMWVLLLGGAVVSVTGFVLGCKYLKRKGRSLRR